MSRRVSLRIRYTRRSDLATLLVLALLTALALGYLAWAAPGSQALPVRERSEVLAASGETRRYYLTKNTFDGSETLTACAPGYHFASLWEIIDPSALRYNTTLGQTKGDSGHGPPARSGWVRTGYMSGHDGIAGRGNCDAWTSDLFERTGTYAFLPNMWNAGHEDLLGWAAGGSACSNQKGVWCMEDVGRSIYLPLVLRNHQP